MSPEELSCLSSKEFSAILADDPVLKDLRSRLVDRKDAVPAALDAILLSGAIRIGELHVQPLTAAKWAFLWIIESPFVSGGSAVSLTDLNIFLYVLHLHDLRNMDFPLTCLPVKSASFVQKTGLETETLIQEISAVISSAFYPLSMLPQSGSNPEDAFYDGAWIAWIASIAVKESGLPYDRVIHELPLSLICNLYVAWRRREGIDGSKIRRPQNGTVMDKIAARIDALGKDFIRNHQE